MLLTLAALALQSGMVPDGWTLHHRYNDGERIASMAILPSEDGRSSLVVKCDTPYGNLSVQYIPARSMGLHERGRTYWTGKPAIELFSVQEGQRRQVGLVWQFAKNSAYATELTPYKLATNAITNIAQSPSELIIEAHDSRREPVTQNFQNRLQRFNLMTIVKDCHAAKQMLQERKR